MIKKVANYFLSNYNMGHKINLRIEDDCLYFRIRGGKTI